jgi:hypothetical protein
MLAMGSGRSLPHSLDMDIIFGAHAGGDSLLWYFEARGSPLEDHGLQLSIKPG